MPITYRNTKIILSYDRFGRFITSTVFANGRLGLCERHRLGTTYEAAVNAAKAYIDRVLS